ncbi:hypothetical protein MRB53_025681 [Persea americana]|uniref:Uncharacterized protein n=1 Tax=Persea americana TaxID=3435 RepID=A0ACC2LGI9_PERAE|nr:hypothetical protein MRB53_025681 [Persea americana]
MVKFQLKKVLFMGVAVGNCGMEEKQVFQNVQLSVNFVVSLLKKNWQNVRCLISEHIDVSFGLVNQVRSLQLEYNNSHIGCSNSYARSASWNSIVEGVRCYS